MYTKRDTVPDRVARIVHPIIYGCDNPASDVSSIPLKVFQYKYEQRYLLTMLLTLSLILWNGYIRTASAAPQSCVLCDKEDIAAKDPRTNYEEFLFEHQVTRQDAIKALKEMNDTFYDGTASGSSCKSIPCDKTIMKYCLGPQFINDHCWCELGHNNEGLPFVPHICYLGEKIHKAYVGSCYAYEEFKDCCCVSALAKQWRHISGSLRISPDLSTSIITMILSLLVIL